MLLSSKRWSSSKRSRASSPYVYGWYLLVYCRAVSIASSLLMFVSRETTSKEMGIFPLSCVLSVSVKRWSRFVVLLR